VAELKREFKNSIKDYLKFYRELNEEPDKPFFGNLMLRITPSLHQRLYSKAKSSGKSLNSLIEEGLVSL